LHGVYSSMKYPSKAPCYCARDVLLMHTIIFLFVFKKHSQNVRVFLN